MVTAYILVLAFSAWLLAALLLYVSRRFGKLFGNPQLISAGFVLLLPLLGFLIVVEAPPPMLVGCLLLAGSHLARHGQYLPAIARVGVPLIAGLIASTHLTMPVVAHVPPAAWYALALPLLIGYGYSGNYLPTRLWDTSLAVLATAAPLLAAPFFGAPAYIALDIMILASVLLGTNMMAAADASVALARQPFGLLLGWLAVSAATHGAWVPALVSLFIYLAFLARAIASPSTEVSTHAA